MSAESVLLYQNKLIGSTITTIAEDVDTFKENAIDSLFWSFWQDSVSVFPELQFDLGSAQAIDSLGIFNIEGDSSNSHGWFLYAGASASPSAMVASGTLTPFESVFISFDAQTFQYWRLVFDGPAKISNVMLGEKLIFERGFETDWMRPVGVDDDEYEELYSEDGFPLGKTIVESGKHMLLAQNDMSHDFFHASWLPFIEYAYGDIDKGDGGNFYISWNESEFPREAIYCVADGHPDKQSYTDRDGTNGKLKIIAYGEVTDASLIAAPPAPIFPPAAQPIDCYDTSGPTGDGSIYELDNDYCVGFVDVWPNAPIYVDNEPEKIAGLNQLSGSFIEITSTEFVNII